MDIKRIALLMWTAIVCPLLPQAGNASAARGVNAGINLQVVTVAGGQPDDITTDAHGRLVWGDLAAGTIKRFDGRRVRVVVRGLSVPEGVVALGNGSLVVAEQGSDRIVQINKRGRLRVLYRLQPVPGQDGVDGMHLDSRTGTLLIADSPRGAVLRLNIRSRTARVVATGLGRPVDAVAAGNGDILIPDEHLGTVVVVAPSGRISYRGTFAIPDDVAVDHSGRVWVTTLGDGGLWVIAPHAAPRRVLAGLANPQGLTLDRCGDPVVVEQNTARIVRLLLTPHSRECQF